MGLSVARSKGIFYACHAQKSAKVHKHTAAKASRTRPLHCHRELLNSKTNIIYYNHKIIVVKKIWNKGTVFYLNCIKMLHQLQILNCTAWNEGADLHLGCLSLAEQLEADPRLYPTGSAPPLMGSCPRDPPFCQAADTPLRVIAAPNKHHCLACSLSQIRDAEKRKYKYSNFIICSF